MTENLKLNDSKDSNHNLLNQYNDIIFTFVLVCFYDEPILQTSFLFMNSFNKLIR